ncbi:MAG: hypothetical protein FJ276_28415 [Planctomycetes bacterium]|nr:hypothetical protein [Planctomycetota bacterium]
MMTFGFATQADCPLLAELNHQRHLMELQDIVFERGAHATDLRAPGEQGGKNNTTQKPSESKGAKR